MNLAIDDPHEDIPELLNQLNLTGINQEDLIVVVDVTGRVKFNEPLSDEIENLRDLLGFRNVIEVDEDDPPAIAKSDRPRGVIVITGHADHELEAYVDRLAASGYLQGNYVVLQSCGAEVAPKIIAKINEEYGALGTFHYPGEIEADDAVTHTKFIAQDTVNDVQLEPFSRRVRDLAHPSDHRWKGAMTGTWTISLVSNSRTRNG